MRKKLTVTRRLPRGEKIKYKTPDKGKPGRTPKDKRWFKPGKPSGWEKSMPAEKRRRLTLQSHGNDLLSAARSKQHLTNVTSDLETKRKAQSDATYFYKKYRAEKKAASTRGGPGRHLDNGA